MNLSPPEATSQQVAYFKATLDASAKSSTKRTVLSDKPESGGAEGYSIRVTARMTGISADQLRVWERRYGFPKPKRNAAGARLYSDEQVQRLALISRALNAGYRARDAIATPPDELRKTLTRAPEIHVSTSASEDVEALIGLLRRNALSNLSAELRRLALARGPKDFVTEIASRLTQRVGEGWASGELEVRHEHLLTDALSTQLRLLLAAYEDAQAWPRVVLATFPNEQHSLGLEMVNLFLATSGARPRMLGVNTPAEQIASAAIEFDCQAVGISVSASANPLETGHFLGALLTDLPEHMLVWLGGANEADFAISPRVVRIRQWWELERELGRLRRPERNA